MENQDGLQAPAPSFEKTPQSPAGAVQIDPAASAALAEAVRSAKEGVKEAPMVAPVTAAQATLPKVTKPTTTLWPRVGQAAAVVALIGAGWLAAYMGTLGNREIIERLAAETARSQEALAKLTSDLESLRGTMASYRDVEQTASTTTATDQAKLAAKVERLAIALQEPGKKLSALEARFDKFEGQITTSLTALSAKPAAAAPSPSEANRDVAVKQAKAEPVDGWVLREVYNGSALVESRNRRLYEVMPGGIIPGVGRVESIERRGTRWVVLTDKGFIGTYR